LAREPDRTVDDLRELFRSHPAWAEAAGRIDSASMSNVYFSDRAGEVWHLVKREPGSDLEAGKVEDPDFVFRFTPGAVRRLQAIEGGIAEFAAELLLLIDETDSTQRIELRVAAPFSRLKERGYLQLLMDAGPKLVRLALSRGIFSISGVRELVRSARDAPPFPWEI